jgi:nickel-dependent lactate racemase
MIYFQTGSKNGVISSDDLKNGIYTALERLGHRKKVLVVPPDYTRFHSRAGEITSLLYKYFRDGVTDILPALGTHTPMTDIEISQMYMGVPKDLFRIHNWRKDVVTAGTVPGEFISEITEGKLNYQWPAQLNKLVYSGGHDLVLSVGQVVPHEVAGMANFNKNIFVGTGGSESINKSHFIGAVYGMERMMGKTDTPVRKLFNYASRNFIGNMPIVYIHTVVGNDEEGKPVLKGLFIGDDEEGFQQAADLSIRVNFTLTPSPLKKVVVFLDPGEFRSTWLGNKSIYRTRMAMADGGELIIIAPGLKEFGEDAEIDRLIRKYGYRGTGSTLEFLEKNQDLRNNLGAAAHLIHGSSEDRFSIIYCPGKLSRAEIESVNFKYEDLSSMIKKYKPEKLREGFNILPGGEEIYFISNPALGLWASKERLA